MTAPNTAHYIDWHFSCEPRIIVSLLNYSHRKTHLWLFCDQPKALSYFKKIINKKKKKSRAIYTSKNFWAELRLSMGQRVYTWLSQEGSELHSARLWSRDKCGSALSASSVHQSSAVWKTDLQSGSIADR